LITEIQKLIYNIEYLSDDDSEIKEFKDNPNDTNIKRFQNQERWYDQIFEKYLKAENLVENEELFQNLFVEFQRNIQQFFRKWKEN
jgi:hypothetical protein